MNVTPQGTGPSDDNLHRFVLEQIERLRPKLLDLSRRNPLISTKLSGRPQSYIRVIDELPDVLFFRLTHGQEFEIAALPPLDDEPADERTPLFQLECPLRGGMTLSV